jgi:phospholipid transport system substrate-binding protein
VHGYSDGLVVGELGDPRRTAATGIRFRGSVPSTPSRQRATPTEITRRRSGTQTFGVKGTTAMRRRGIVLGLTIAAMCLIGPGLEYPAAAGEATDQIRTHIEQMYRLVAQTGSTAESRAAVRKLADQMFNWVAMAEAALGSHWRERTPSERSEFVRVFADVFERAYLSKIQLTDAERFAYLGEIVEGDQSVVQTRITTTNGSVIPVNYRVRRTEAGAWQVYDLDVGGVSLVGNYRTQFNAIIARSSYPELVNRLKTLREQHGGTSSSTTSRST